MKPDDARIADLVETLRIGPTDPKLLNAARRLASSGKPAEAILAYQRFFKRDTPTVLYVGEYYMTVGSIQERREEAQIGLAGMLAKDPTDVSLQFDLAKLQSFREATRANAIDTLQALSKIPEIEGEVRKVWHDALQWQGADLRAKAQLQAYMKQYPNDTSLAALLDDYMHSLPREQDLRRFAGYQAMERKDYSVAETEFEATLAMDDTDFDAMAMLAAVKMRHNQPAEAKRLIDRALELAPDRRADILEPLGGVLPFTGAANNASIDTRLAARANQAAEIRRGYLKVEKLTASKDFAGAESALQRLKGDRPQASFYVQLGSIQLLAAHMPDAEANFRQALKLDPNEPAALRALATLKVAGLRTQLAGAADPAEKMRLLRAIVMADPANPWSSLELARFLANRHDMAQARQVMANVAAGPHPSLDEIQAALYWADAHKDLSRVSVLVGPVPVKDRTPLMVNLATRASVEEEIRHVIAVPNRPKTDKGLLAIAAQSDPTGERGASVARTLIQFGDKDGARAAIFASLAATGKPTALQRLTYVTALTKAGFADSTAQLLHDIDARDLTPLEATQLDNLQIQLAVMQSDSLLRAGKSAAAKTVIRAPLQAKPDNPQLKLALARAYLADRRPANALRITKDVLEQTPDNLDVQRAVVGAAIGAGAMKLAAQLAADAQEITPRDPRVYLMAANVAQAHGKQQQALASLLKARALREQEQRDGNRE